MINGRTYYQVLEVSPEVSAEELKRAYRRLALQYHPDRTASTGNSGSIFQEIQEAYEHLSSVERRRAYDERLSSQQKRGEQKGAEGEFTYPDPNNLKIYLPNWNIIYGKPFEVQIKSFIGTASVHLHGSNHVRILSGPIHYEISPRLTEAHYVLISDTEGYVTVGPATVRRGKVIHVSAPMQIRVMPQPTEAEIRKERRYNNIIFGIAATGLSLMLFVIGFNYITYNVLGSRQIERQYKVFQNKMRPADGSIPYQTLFDRQAKVNPYNHIDIQGDDDLDAVIFLVNYETDKVITNHYVKAGSRYRMSYIPTGDYYLRVIVGKYWDPEARLSIDFEEGGFMTYKKYFHLKDKEMQLKFGNIKSRAYNYEVDIQLIRTLFGKGFEDSEEVFFDRFGID